MIHDRQRHAAAHRFLRTRIPRGEALDILLFLRSRLTWLLPQEVSRALRVPLGSVRAALEKLAQQGLLDVRLASDLMYRYAPLRKKDRDAIRQLADRRAEQNRGT
jgi:hypothetical protein